MNNMLENYKKQQQSKILMAKPEELTAMLYDGAIKFCNVAIIAIEKKDFEKAHENIVKVQKIIEYLINTLNTDYEVSKDFMNIYVYLLDVLVKANIKKDIETLNIAIKELKDLKNIWEQIIVQNQQPKKWLLIIFNKFIKTYWFLKIKIISFNCKRI